MAASALATATAASRPSRRYGQASSDGVPQFSPAMMVSPVVMVPGSPRTRLARTQAAEPGSTVSNDVPAEPGRLR